MTRWHHGHSLGAGALFGVTLAQHGVLLVLAGLAVGVSLREVVRAGKWAGRTVAERVARPSVQKISHVVHHRASHSRVWDDELPEGM